ncbi:MAG: hypothetical protein WD972_00380 [Candidatus Andersenbacteria bacterium]
MSFKEKWGMNFVGSAYAVAIALLFLFLLQTIAVQITPPPAIMTEPYPDTSTPELCSEAGGTWFRNTGNKNIGRPVPAPVTDQQLVEGYCQGPLAFEREREIQADKSRQTSLFVFAIGGAIAVAASVLIQQVKVIPAGFVLGGIFAFFVAGTQLWQLVPGIGRLITIAVLFLFLLGIGWYVFHEKKQGV